jgi:hypothetical protein
MVCRLAVSFRKKKVDDPWMIIFQTFKIKKSARRSVHRIDFYGSSPTKFNLPRGEKFGAEN